MIFLEVEARLRKELTEHRERQHQKAIALQECLTSASLQQAYSEKLFRGCLKKMNALDVMSILNTFPRQNGFRAGSGQIQGRFEPVSDRFETFRNFKKNFCHNFCGCCRRGWGAHRCHPGLPAAATAPAEFTKFRNENRTIICWKSIKNRY